MNRITQFNNSLHKKCHFPFVEKPLRLQEPVVLNVSSHSSTYFNSMNKKKEMKDEPVDKPVTVSKNETIFQSTPIVEMSVKRKLGFSDSFDDEETFSFSTGPINVS